MAQKFKMWFSRISRILDIAKVGSCLLPSLVVSKKRILIFVHPAHINSPLDGKLSCDKIDPLKSILGDDFQILEFIIPPLGSRHKRYSYISLNKQYSFYYLVKKFRRTVTSSTSTLVFNHLIRKYKPNCVLTIGVHPDLIRSCIQFSVPYIEVQHGWISREYLKLIYSDGLTPTYFLTWSDHYSRLFRSSGEMGLFPTPIAIGPPLIYSKNFVNSPRLKRKKILFALSNEIPDSIDPFGCINEVDLHFLSEMIAEYGLDLVKLRCHPVLVSRMDFSSIETWFRSKWPGINLSNPHQVELYKDLRCARMLVGPATSLSIEAAALGIPSHLRLTENTNYNYSHGLHDDSHSYIDPFLVLQGYIHVSRTYSTEVTRAFMDSNFRLPGWEQTKFKAYQENLRTFLHAL